MAGNGDGRRPAQLVPSRNRPERLGEIRRPTCVVGRVGRMCLEREILKDQATGSAEGEDTAGNMTGTDIDC